MSTQYTFEPPIKYEDFLKGKCFVVQDPPRKYYLKVPIAESATPEYNEHMVIRRDKTYLHVFNDNGNAHLERFGANNIENIIPYIIEEFNVKVFDEFGLEFPDCTG